MSLSKADGFLRKKLETDRGWKKGSMKFVKKTKDNFCEICYNIGCHTLEISVAKSKRDAGCGIPFTLLNPCCLQQSVLFTAEGTALGFFLAGDLAATGAHAHAGGRAAPLAVMLATACVTADLLRDSALAACFIKGACHALFAIRCTAGLVADAGSFSCHMDGRKPAAACIVMGTGIYLTFQFCHCIQILSLIKSHR